MKSTEKKLHKICVYFNDKDIEKVYKIVYKEKTTPSKVLRKALEMYIEKNLLEDKEPIIS